MGFSTVYLRPFKFDRRLTQGHAAELGEYASDEYDCAPWDCDGTHSPGPFYCQWVPTEDLAGLEWDGVEKFYFGKEWLEHLIAELIAPWGYRLNGQSPWYINDFDQAGVLSVVDNVVHQEPRDIALIKSEYGEHDETL